MLSPRASKRRRTSRQTETSLSPSAGTNTPATSCSSPTPSSTSKPSSPPAPLRRFLQWCDKQGMAIDSRLDLRYTQYNPNSWSISIHASTPIPADTVVVTIPKPAVLSRKTSSLSPFLHSESQKYLSDNPETVGLELALCLLYERLLHSRSRFAPFLSILPRLPLALPFLQSPLLPWLRGTETERINTRAQTAYYLSTTDPTWVWEHDYGMCRSKALDYFHDIAIPLLRNSGMFDKVGSEHLEALQAKFLACYTHVSSRDFIVDAWHGVGLVPVAELFNHAEVNTVQFESDQDVCEACGVALIAGHDQKACLAAKVDADSDSDNETEADIEEEEQEEEHVTAAAADVNKVKEEEQPKDDPEKKEDDDELDVQDSLDLRILTPHTSGEEIYNTYGPLTNALLLTRYGFCLDTETDFERYTVDIRFARERRELLEAFHSTSTCSFAAGGMEEVVGVFVKVLAFVRTRFPPSEEEEGNEQDEQEKLNRAIDQLHHFDSLLPTIPPSLSNLLTPLIHHPSPAPIDQDLVERDQLHPLYLNSTGQTSLPLFTLIYLMHHFHPPSFSLEQPLPTIELTNAVVQATLSTLHAFWLGRLQHLHIFARVEEGLRLLQPETKESMTKACIQHAYQEYAALKSALAALEDLIITAS